MQKLFAATALCAALCAPDLVLAYETDQFTLPRAPLADVAEEIDARFRDDLLSAVAEQNERGDLSEKGLARAFYSRGGPGHPATRLEKWIARRKRIAKFKLSWNESVYRRMLTPLPGTFLVLAPTINLYGVSLGTDKLGHFIQQGYEYFDRYLETEAASGSAEEAARSAIAGGVGQETGYFGVWLGGVYSNADLAANYLGLQFYLNLMRPIRLGDRELPPRVRVEGGKLVVNGDRALEDLLRPYVSDHLNEAFNPAAYSFFRPRLRKNVRARCESWRERYPELMASRQSVVAFEESLRTLHGVDYGNDRTRNGNAKGLISIASECF